MVCEVQRTVRPRCSPEVGKSKMLTMEERNERLERWDPDSRALCIMEKGEFYTGEDTDTRRARDQKVMR